MARREVAGGHRDEELSEVWKGNGVGREGVTGTELAGGKRDLLQRYLQGKYIFFLPWTFGPSVDEA